MVLSDSLFPNQYQISHLRPAGMEGLQEEAGRLGHLTEFFRKNMNKFQNKIVSDIENLQRLLWEFGLWTGLPSFILQLGS
jgi:hypothetical protein